MKQGVSEGMGIGMGPRIPLADINPLVPLYSSRREAFSMSLLAPFLTIPHPPFLNL